MKKFGFIILGLALILTSCDVRRPRADFEPTKYVVEPYEEIVFQNYSSYADIYDWDFGDGYYSSVEEPAHYFTRPGKYTVQLTAVNGDYEDVCYVDIEVVGATLDVQVLEYYDEYAISGAKVILYRTYADWLDQRNPLIEAFTNADGIAIIDYLDPGYYYMDIWERNHNNEQLGIRDPANVRTLPLIMGRVTQMTTYVDYVPSSSSLKSRPVERQKNANYEPKLIRIPHERK